MTMFTGLTDRLRPALAALAAGAALALAPLPAGAAGGVEVPSQEWSFDGFFGQFDRPSLQRGLQIYTQVCASCHGLDHLYYRNLQALGYSEEEVIAYAAQFQVTDGPNDQGEMYNRPARPSDNFRNPFPNEERARAANNGALPVDLSLITKARPDGANYLYAFLTGYGDPPEGETVGQGMHWNEYFPGHQVAMADMLGLTPITYEDGTEASLSQKARDITSFLVWAAEPTMEERKELGLNVILFLIAFTALMYAVKRKVWADVH